MWWSQCLRAVFMIKGMSKNHNLHSDQSLHMQSIPERNWNRKKAHQVVWLKRKSMSLSESLLAFAFLRTVNNYWIRFLWWRSQKTKAFFTHWDLHYYGYHKNRITNCNCVIIHPCFEENNGKHSIPWNTFWPRSWKWCLVRAHNPQTSQ